ncbi:MAG: hypothetical protein ACR652_17550 [Methylocystis sp.]|uniref:hypothetical protein n=1 Tax=Methylocystis sp. TaxID=1911079 RepID=UPI003DA6910F
MTARPNLRVVKGEEPTVEDELRTLLRCLDRVKREKATIEGRMQPLRRQYADDRGEVMLPTIERLQRELLS